MYRQLKFCPKCETEKPFADFYQIANGCRNGLSPYCKACHRQIRRTQYWADTAKSAKADRRYRLQNLYGMTLDDYERMSLEQGGVCSCCGGAPGKKGLQIDHNHTTGKVRSLLCNWCNAGLGNFFDSIERMQLGIAYLRKHGGR